MPVRNCCLGCQNICRGACGPNAGRCDCCTGPSCVHSVGVCCNNCECGIGCLHGARGGLAGSFYSCGHGCIGGCTSGLCASCCGPRCS